LAAFAAEGVEYLVVGGYAVAYWGEPRFTKDIDLWIGSDPANVRRTLRALKAFGAPEGVVDELEAATESDVLWMGRPPLRIDLLKGVPGGCFAEAYRNRVEADWDGTRVSMVAREDLVALKRASGRAIDLVDLAMLEEHRASGEPRPDRKS